MHAEVPPAIPFRDPAFGARGLSTLYEACATSGSNYSLEKFAPLLEDLLRESPDPDLALVNLLRFVEASFNRASLFNDLVQYPGYSELLVRLFGNSRYFADILVREPELFRWLTTAGVLERPLDRAELEEEFRHLSGLFSRTERLLDSIKRIHRREILRIGAQDTMGAADLAGVTRQLSDLADVLCDAVLTAARRQMADRYPLAPEAPFTILGLGKLGGQELNYSSDIDILIVYGAEGNILDATGRESSHHEYFNRLSEIFVQMLSQPSAEGSLYRVDTRLRPESGAGPLARSLQSYLMYYESRGELWERQMLIKARPVAGDRRLGEEFIAQLQPFVYPRTSFQHPSNAIARIKAKIEAKVGDEANIKLRAGGIRDIEFIVQALQLINGGKRKELRGHNTLHALASLEMNGLLSPSEARSLTTAYVFYRTLEHRLQIMQNTQTHTIPDDPSVLTALARRLGYADGSRLTHAINKHLREVRTLFEQVMALRPGTAGSDIQAVIEGSLSDEETGKVLASYGLTDLRAASRALRTLTGISLTGQQEMDARTRAVFREAAPALFKGIAATPNPDMTLRNISSLVSAHAAPRQLYDALSDPHFRRLILDIAAVSPRLTRALGRSPLVLDIVMSDVRALAEGRPLTLPQTADIIEFKNQQELRTGLRYVLGFATFDRMTLELSRLAEFIVSTLFEWETAGAGMRSPAMAVFGLGKFGTREVNFDADLDLLFVSSAKGATAQSKRERAAAAMVQRLTSVSASGRLYDVDVRLRPEGRNAPLVASLHAYGEYLGRRASLWERQSLTRLRFLCGDAALGEATLSMVHRFVYETPLPPQWTGEIAAMRGKMETRSRTRGGTFIDIKLGPGGMADIEFILQMLQLRYGGVRPELRHGAIPALLAIEDLPVLTDQERHFLAETYALYRRIETFLRLTLEERSAILPEGEKLRELARVFDRSDGNSIQSMLNSEMRKVRATFDAVCQRMMRL